MHAAELTVNIPVQHTGSYFLQWYKRSLVWAVLPPLTTQFNIIHVFLRINISMLSIIFCNFLFFVGTDGAFEVKTYAVRLKKRATAENNKVCNWSHHYLSVSLTSVKTSYRLDITEILLKVALSTITLNRKNEILMTISYNTPGDGCVY